MSITTSFGAMPMPVWWDATLADQTGAPPRNPSQTEPFLTARAGHGGQWLTLQMSPPALGPVTIVLGFTDHGLQAHITADNADAARLIEQFTPQLRHSLMEGWDVGTIRVVHRLEPVPADDSETKPPRRLNTSVYSNKTSGAIQMERRRIDEHA